MTVAGRKRGEQTMKRLFWLLAALPLASFGIEVKSGSLSVKLDDAEKGRICSLMSKDGVDFCFKKLNPPALFGVVLYKKDAFTNGVAVTASQAGNFACEKTADGARLTYWDFPADKPVSRVVCTVGASAGDKRLRWRICVTSVPGWAVVETKYPHFYLTDRLGETSADDGFVTGSSGSSGVIASPGAAKREHWYRSTRQPGYLAVPMALYYDPSALFYTACEDAVGEVKSFTAYNHKNVGGIDFVWTHHSWNETEAALPYDVTMAAIDGKANDPLTWEDGCDLYREWSDDQPWSKAKFKDRPDIPDFLRGPVAYMDIGSRWRELYAPDGKALERWARESWAARFPGAKAILHFDAWERNGTYIMTDYFPLHPTNEAFKRHADEMCRHNVYVNPWPSGFRRAPAYDKRVDGTFACDEREAFDRVFRPHSCLMRNGSLFRRDTAFSWLRGGWFHSMCGGDPWTLSWFADDISGKLADLGVHGISCDQNIGGDFPSCWSKAHGHQPGDGPWKVVAARETAIRSLAAMRRRHGDAFFCFEEPNEQVNDVVQLNNSRQAWGAKPMLDWCSPFDYIYHDSAPIFGLGGYGLVGQAHGIASGFMPRCGVRKGDVEKGSDLFANADFESVVDNGTRCAMWERGSAPNGPDFDVRHGGKVSLRIARPSGTNSWTHVARNLECADDAFEPGATYRFSAWMKLGNGRAWIDVGVFGGKGSLAWTRLSSPSDPKAGWQLVTADLVYPKGDVNMVRIMFNLKEGSVAWVDDMKVERKMEDGSYRPLRYEGSNTLYARERKWMDFYSGPAHEWLAYGRRVKAPRVKCGTVDYPGKARPAVFCGAYVSPAGEKALVFANASAAEQRFSWAGPDGEWHDDSLAGADMKLVLVK